MARVFFEKASEVLDVLGTALLLCEKAIAVIERRKRR
jgi:hypothetical protein